MAAFVLDASVAIADLSLDEDPARTFGLVDRAIDEPVAIPAVWYYEVTNVFTSKLRRGVLRPEQHRDMLVNLRDLRVECDPRDLQSQCEAACALSARHKITVYDAAYLELALRLKIPLATLDKALANAARDAGVAVLP